MKSLTFVLISVLLLVGKGLGLEQVEDDEGELENEISNRVVELMAEGRADFGQGCNMAGMVMVGFV